MKMPFPELGNPKPEIRQAEEPHLWLPPLAVPSLSAQFPEPQTQVFEEYRGPVDPNAEPSAVWEAAQREGETLISEAKSQAQIIRQQAWEQGYRNGHAQAEKEMGEKLELLTLEMRQQVEKFLKTLQQEAEHYFEGLENQMLDLTFQIARKVIKEEVKQNPETVRNVIRDALRRVHGFGLIRVRVHPHDLTTARAGRTAFLNIVEGVQGIEIAEDRRVEPGSCVIETEHGTIDARLSVQLDEIEQVLRAA